MTSSSATTSSTSSPSAVMSTACRPRFARSDHETLTVVDKLYRLCNDSPSLCHFLPRNLNRMGTMYMEYMRTLHP